MRNYLQAAKTRREALTNSADTIAREGKPEFPILRNVNCALGLILLGSFLYVAALSGARDESRSLEEQRAIRVQHKTQTSPTNAPYYTMGNLRPEDVS